MLRRDFAEAVCAPLIEHSNPRDLELDVGTPCPPIMNETDMGTEVLKN